MPEEQYDITDRKPIDEIEKDFYWNYERGNSKTYVIFRSAENLV